MSNWWIPTQCILCGQGAAKPLLTLPHADAPMGLSYIVRCGKCGLRRLDPRPSPAIIHKYYDQGYYAFLGRSRGPFKQWCWDLLRDVSSDAPVRRGPWHWTKLFLDPIAEWLFDINVPLDRSASCKVIEVGCGYGDLLIYLQSRGCQALGIDLDPRAAAKAKEYGVTVLTGRLRDVNLLEASFDLAILCHSLEHLPDPGSELRELARLLKPLGQIHIAVPNGDAIGFRAEGANWAHLSHPLHFWYFDSNTLTLLLEQCGFKPMGPARTTSRHHYLMRFIQEIRSAGLITAAKRWRPHLISALTAPDTGDVLRIQAQRRLS